MPIRRSFILLAFVLVLSSLCFSQDDDAVRVDSSIVRVNVGVVDDRGRPITTLGQTSFTV